MNRKVYIAQSSIAGTGVFARGNFAVHETLFFLAGKLLNLDAALAMGSAAEVLIQVAERDYILPTFPALHINHCCTPNVGISDDFTFKALRGIYKGDEITFDYSTTMLERLWTMGCNCQSSECRRTIRDFDLLPAALQNLYLDRGIVQQFIVDKVRPSRKSAAAA